MAGVAERLPAPIETGMFSALARVQYAALARMRWSMFRNGIRSRKGALELGARVGMMLLYAVMGLGMAFGLGAAAYGITRQGEWEFLPILFWVVCFLWQMVPISMASFQQQFDPGGLLRFPVSFGGYYLLHVIFGLVDASTILGGFCCAGLLVGVSVVRPDLFGWMIVTLLVFAVFNIFLVRAIFAWIDRWLAQRRTREILTAIFFVGLLSMQLLNPAFHMNTRRGPMSAESRAQATRWLERANQVQRWLPPGLAADIVESARADKPAQSLESLALLAVFVLGTGGVLAGRLRAEYRGESLGEAPARREAKQVRQGRLLTVGSGPVAAVVEKELRTLLRAMPFLYSLGAPLLMVVVFASMFRARHVAPGFPIALLLFLAYGLVGFTQLLYNNLGAEGVGIQILFLSPTPIRTVIFAKNLFHAALFGLEALIICIISAWRVGLPGPDALAATLCWLLFAVPTHLAAGDVFSIVMPYRINLGRIGRQRGSQANALLSLVIQAGVLGAGAGVLMLCSFFAKLWLAIPIFLVMAAGAIFAWMRVLANVDRMANRRREDLVSELVRAE
jgi:ABC-2 type transport system permease protein